MINRMLGFTTYLAMTASAFAMGAESPVTWLKSANDLPKPVARALKDCPYLKPSGGGLAEAWEPNGESGGFRAKLDGGRELYVVTCDLGASNAMEAAVLFAGGRAKRLTFPFVDETGAKSSEPMIANSTWKNGALTSGLLQGCAGVRSTSATHVLEKDRFVLDALEWQVPDDKCKNPKTKVIYQRQK
jgi:hypothetical protein